MSFSTAFLIPLYMVGYSLSQVHYEDILEYILMKSSRFSLCKAVLFR